MLWDTNEWYLIKGLEKDEHSPELQYHCELIGPVQR